MIRAVQTILAILLFALLGAHFAAMAGEPSAPPADTGDAVCKQQAAIKPAGKAAYCDHYIRMRMTCPEQVPETDVDDRACALTPQTGESLIPKPPVEQRAPAAAPVTSQ